MSTPSEEADRVLTGKVVAMDRANVDTDQIIPKQFLKRIERTGYGPLLFADKRYAPGGAPSPDHPEQHEGEDDRAAVAQVVADDECGAHRVVAQRGRLLGRGMASCIESTAGAR